MEEIFLSDASLESHEDNPEIAKILDSYHLYSGRTATWDEIFALRRRDGDFELVYCCTSVTPYAFLSADHIVAANGAPAVNKLMTINEVKQGEDGLGRRRVEYRSGDNRLEISYQEAEIGRGDPPPWPKGNLLMILYSKGGWDPLYMQPYNRTAPDGKESEAGKVMIFSLWKMGSRNWRLSADPIFEMDATFLREPGAHSLP